MQRGARELAQQRARRSRRALPARFAVDGITDQRMADALEVNADLVRAAGEQLHLEKRRRRDVVQGAHARVRRAPVLAHRHFLASSGVPPDRHLDVAGALELAVADGEVLLLDRARRERARQSLIGRRRARDHDDAARPLIEAVHDAGSPRPADAGELGEARQQPVHERARAAPRARVHDQSGWLVDRQQRVVLVEDHQLARLGLEPIVAGGGRLLPLELHAGLEAARRLRRRAVDPHAAVVDPALDLVARQLEVRGEEAIQPLAARLTLHPQRAPHRGDAA